MQSPTTTEHSQVAATIHPMLLLNSSFLSLPRFFKSQVLGRTNLLSHSIGSPHKCYATSANVSQRKSANYQPNIWNYDTLQSLKHEYTDVRYMDRSRRLQDEVRRMIKDENVMILDLVYTVKHLGLSYIFEKEIREALHRFLSLEKRSGTINIGRSLHETALRFSLLREYGYDVSPDIFEMFKDHNGNFKACLVQDIKGMLSLYEASFLSYEGEHILDEANAFTSIHLKSLRGDRSSILFEQVNHSLELPLHRRVQSLEARWYIESYEKRMDANKVLLEAAKLNFNIVQSTLQHDLKEMSRWWKGMGLAPRLSFGRDRLMECFFWAAGMAPFEVQYSDLRKGLTKVCSLITLIDDIYDVYGTLDELELFTTAVESWDINAIQILPEYMKIIFLALYNTVNELTYDTLKEKGHDILPYLVKAWSGMLKAFLQEARWCHNKHIPKFDDYLNNAWVSVSGVVLLTHTYFLLNHSMTKEESKYLENYNLLLQRPSIIFRLCNDLATSSAELERGEGANSIICYMNENGISEKVAYKQMQSLLNETWKKMNKDRVTNSLFPKYFVETTINLARISHCTYQYGDGHGAPDDIAKNRINALILEPIN